MGARACLVGLAKQKMRDRQDRRRQHLWEGREVWGSVVHAQELPAVQSSGPVARKGRSHKSRARAIDAMPSILNIVRSMGCHQRTPNEKKPICTLGNHAGGR